MFSNKHMYNCLINCRVRLPQKASINSNFKKSLAHYTLYLKNACKGRLINWVKMLNMWEGQLVDLAVSHAKSLTSEPHFSETGFRNIFSLSLPYFILKIIHAIMRDHACLWQILYYLFNTKWYFLATSFKIEL